MYHLQSSHKRQAPVLWIWVLMMLLSANATTALADEIKKEANYTATVHGDHISLEVMVADLKSANTWCKSGSIRAYSQSGRKGTVLHLMDVETDNCSNDNEIGWELYAQTKMPGSMAFLTNSMMGEQTEIKASEGDEWSQRADNVKYTLRKGMGDRLITAKIDFYFPPEMVESNTKWYIYYEYLHSGGSSYNMSMGTVELSRDMGLSHLDTSKYTVSEKRTKPDEFEFTTPALPDDVTYQLKDNRWHEGIYTLTLTYTLKNGKQRTQTEVLKCEATEKKHTVKIPEEVGNFKSVDLSIRAQDILRSVSGKCFWDQAYTYTKTALLPGVPVPSQPSGEYDMYNGTMRLVWDAYDASQSGFITSCTPYVYRRKVDSRGVIYLSDTWSKRGTLSGISNKQQSYTDTNLEPGSYYKYMVVNVPNAWIESRGVTSSQLNEPDGDLLNWLGYAFSDALATDISMGIRHLRQDTTVTDKVRLTWEYDRVPVKVQKVQFQVWKKAHEGSDWKVLGTVDADAAPKSGTVLSFTDSNLADKSERFDYKVSLAINDGQYVFESDVVTAGLLAGTLVKNLEVSKGTHESTVRLTWGAKQIGTGKTIFVVSRRYAGAKEDFMRVYTVSGTADTYTYEDNTVQPGYYYEYKVEAYSGEIAAELLQNSLTDVGFCQARGVISGRVTFGTGTAVEDVRLSLRSSDSDGHGVKGYSQYVGGASEGIWWDADSAATAKLFGSGKDYTVQLFVRPDSALSEGAVVGNIPGLGHIVLGKEKDGRYPLHCVQTTVNTSQQTFTETNAFRAVCFSPYEDKYYDETEQCTVYGQNSGLGVGYQWESEGYKMLERIYINEGTGYWFALYGRQKTLDEPVNCDVVETVDNTYDLGLDLAANAYSLLTISNRQGQWSFSVNDSTSTDMTFLHKKEITTEVSNFPADYVVYNNNLVNLGGTLVDNFHGDRWKNYVKDVAADIQQGRTEIVPGSFAVGGAQGIADEQAFRGHLTEVRVWDHVLSDKEQATYADRVLSGREQGLRLYWPMDEGLDHYVFDASYANDVPNGRHAIIGVNVSSSVIIPSDEILSRYGLTDSNGEYTIRGIPFVGTGTNYTIVPSKSIHTFSPQSRNGFIGNGNLTLNAYDFTDNSSFTVKGKVTYLDTNIPVDSIQFKVDGALQKSKDGMLMTNADGEYELSVPIGEHRIEAYREGHRLTSFPLDGTAYDFHRAETVNFIDSTLVNVTGRINGGFSDQDAPVGFGLSTNRIGQATIKLSLGKEAQCSFNYRLDEHGDGTFGTEPIAVESASELVGSKAWRGGGEHDDTYYVYITTDAQTGEYSALLPPLKYKVESITFAGGTDYDSEPVFSQNLPMIDATSAQKDKQQTDSATVDGVKEAYTYAAKMNRQLRVQPTVSVVQTGARNGHFGEEKVAVKNIDGTVDSVAVVTFTDTGYLYTFGHPIYVSGQQYYNDISVAERYKNLDTGEEVCEYPEDAVVTIINDASALVSVYAEKAMVNGEEVEAGTEYEVPVIQCTPDADGMVYYQFVGGFPNLAEGNLRNFSVSVNIDGRKYMWHAPDSEGDALDLIVLGAVASGANFVTQGPDQVDYILRRPPGSTSVATYEDSTVRSYKKSTIDVEGDMTGGGVYVSVGVTVEKIAGTAILMDESKFKGYFETSIVREGGWKDTDAESTAESYSLTEKISTPKNAVFSPTTGEYRSDAGDTFFGRSTNQLFCKGRILGIYKQDDGTYALEERQGITVGESFGTTFVYTQEYIEHTLIPNWKALIDSKLTHVNGNHWDASVAKKVEGEVMYYTMYQPGDAEYGRSNGDTEYWGNRIGERGGWPSYRVVNGTDQPNVEDEVQTAIIQIQRWQDILAMNEEDKLKAFDNTSEYLEDNYSFAGGTSVNHSDAYQHETKSGHSHSYTWVLNSETHFGLLVDDIGGYAIVTHKDTHGDGNESATTESSASKISWTLSDGDSRTALSVDVFKSPLGYGPIFRTRGGQSVNPYEGATYTQYYKKGAQMDEATMRIERPVLVVESPLVTGVPSGGEAEFTLKMSNQSETGHTGTFILDALENSNPNGAVLLIDGMPLSVGHGGRQVKISAGQTLEKTLVVTQSDRSVNVYDDIRLVLRSEKDLANRSDEAILRVEFVPASAQIDLAVAHTVLNQADEEQYGGFQVTLSNLDRQDTGLKGVRLQYRRKGLDTWNLAHLWVADSQDLEQGAELLPEASTALTHQVVFPADGTYELRAQTYGKYGQDDVTYETAVIELVQDTRGPKLLGMVSPLNGNLTYTERNNMHLRFNEAINNNALSQSDNFVIEGNLNNVVNDAYADVAYQMNGECQTQADFDLADKDVAIGFWIYRQGDGDILSLGRGESRLSLSSVGGRLKFETGAGQASIMTDEVLPADKWNYVAISYKHSVGEGTASNISALYANSDNPQPVYLLSEQPVGDIVGNGPLVVGGAMTQGRMHDLTLWNTYKTAQELYESRDWQKANYTPGLVGYWRMDEGHGLTMADRVRSRDLYMAAENWYINNENRAAHLDGSEALKIDVATFNPRSNDNFAMEMWFRGDASEQNNEAQLLSAQSGLCVGFAGGKLTLSDRRHSIDAAGQEQTEVVKQTVLSDLNYCDGAWHHFALNVRRGISAVAYIDGQAVKTLPEGDIAGLSTQYLTVGGEGTLLAADGTNSGGATNLFAGDVDEVRLWSAALDGQLIADRMYDRLDNTYAGLVGYFPMEDISRSITGTVTTTFSTENKGVADSQLTLVGTPSQSLTAPALKPGSSRMRLDDRQFGFTASADEIYFTFGDDVLPLMDGNDFTVTVSNIKDEHGNNSETVSWTFHADFAGIYWADEEYDVNLEKRWDETLTYNLLLLNPTGQTQSYVVTGNPSWMMLDKLADSSSKSIINITMTLPPSVPVGRHTEFLYVTDSRGIKRALKVNVTVTGDEPDWAVNTSLYEGNMTLRGQILVGDKISDYTRSKVAAFDTYGNFRGVASPAYVKTRDAYYVDMVIYGNADTDPAGRELTFRYYDASTGVTYPMVQVQMPDGTAVQTIAYANDAVYGSYDAPVRFVAQPSLLQYMQLASGWTWASIYVDPYTTSISNVLQKAMQHLMNIKGHKAFSTVSTDRTEVVGELKEIVPGAMYKIQSSAAVQFEVIGAFINVRNTEQTIQPGYNWIGSLSNVTMSPEQAFADLQPENGDMVKTRSAFSTYRDGVWEGELRNIIPGVGYIYQSQADKSKAFRYPQLQGSTAAQAAAYNLSDFDDHSMAASSYYTPADEHLFPDNMNMIAVVKKDGMLIENAEVAAFVGNECRGAVECNNGYYFLTVLGSSTDDQDVAVEIRVRINGEEYTVASQAFISDAFYGTLDEPYVLDVDATSIRTVNIDDVADDEDWYTIQGQKLSRRPQQQGVYIHHGQKVMVKRK